MSRPPSASPLAVLCGARRRQRHENSLPIKWVLDVDACGIQSCAAAPIVNAVKAPHRAVRKRLKDGEARLAAASQYVAHKGIAP